MRFKNEADLQKWLEQARSGTPKAAIKAASPEPRQLDPSVQRRILGVDTALRCTGWGIIDVRNGIMKAVDCGVIKNSSKEKVSDCLRRLSIGMRELVSLYKPDSAVMEGAFYFRKGDWHYIIYSGNCYQSKYYYLGYAVAHTAETDLTKIKFTKYPDENTYAPLIAANEFESGTGHNSVFEENGEYYAVYHGRDNQNAETGKTAETRTARICRLLVDGERLTAVRYPDKV